MFNDNGSQDPGVNIFVNNVPDPIFMTMSQFLNLGFFLSRLNPIEVALSILKFVGHPHPDQDDNKSVVRKENNNNKTFFDRVGAKKKDDDN